MGILQQEVPFKRMSAEHRTGLQDAVVLILERFLMPALEQLDIPQDTYCRTSLLPLAAHGDGHALVLALEANSETRNKYIDNELMNCIQLAISRSERIALPKYSKKQNSENKQTEAEHTQFLQPELRFVASETRSKNQQGRSPTKKSQYLAAVFCSMAKILATKPERHRTKKKRIWQAPLRRSPLWSSKKADIRRPGVFRIPRNLGALPDLWLQTKLTISLKQFQDKWARMLVVAVAAEQWLRLLPGA